MNNILFTVVIPLYNKEKYIKRCILSVLRQTHNDFELIVVDDGSTDKGPDIVAAIDDSRVTLIKQDNRGEAGARNTGVSAANGSWVAFLDADDEWLGDHLSCLNSIIQEYGDAGMVATQILRLGNSEIATDPDMASSGKIRRVNYFEEAAENIGVITSSSVSIRKDVFESVGGFKNYKMGCDLEFWARVALKYPVAVSDRRTSVYFSGTGGVMETESASTGAWRRPIISELSQLSPSVRMLVERINNGELDDSGPVYQSVVKYINSRIDGAVRGAFVRRDVPSVKALGQLYLGDGQGERRGWRHMSLLPAPAINVLSGFRQVAKHAYSQLKR